MDTPLFNPKSPGCTAIRNRILGDLSKKQFNQRRSGGGEQSYPSSCGHYSATALPNALCISFWFYFCAQGRLRIEHPHDLSKPRCR
jgi:hypothetical protein